MNKRYFKKSKEELEDYLRLMRKHSAIPSKKGKVLIAEIPSIEAV